MPPTTGKQHKIEDVVNKAKVPNFEALVVEEAVCAVY